MENKKDCECTVVHCKKEPYDVYIGRPSKWGNPFTHIKDGKTLAKYVVNSRYEAIEAYREWITNGDGKYLIKDLPELKNKTLDFFLIVFRFGIVGERLLKKRVGNLCRLWSHILSVLSDQLFGERISRKSLRWIKQ